LLLAEAGETTTFTKHRMEMETNAQQSQAGNIVVAALRPQPTLTVTEVHRPRDEDSQLHSLSKCFEKQKAPGKRFSILNSIWAVPHIVVCASRLLFDHIFMPPHLTLQWMHYGFSLFVWLLFHAIGISSASQECVECILIKFPGDNHYHQQIVWLHFGGKLKQAQARRIRQKIRIGINQCCYDVKTGAVV